MYELNNNQRRYFGLHLVDQAWERVQLSDAITVYFSADKIVKVLNYGWGYVEYDTVINTVNRQVLLPMTDRGKQQKLSVPRLLKIKGCGVQFSGSFNGGNIHVYDNRRNLFFIKSFAEDGDMREYADIDNWVSNYIAGVPPDYFHWLTDQLSQSRLKVKAQAGDIIAYKLTATEFGFARILSDVYRDRKSSTAEMEKLMWFHPRSLIVAPYAFFATTTKVNLDELIKKPALPSVCMFDIDVYRGEMPVIGHRPLSDKEREEMPYPVGRSTAMTLNITKQQLEKVIAGIG